MNNTPQWTLTRFLPHSDDLMAPREMNSQEELDDKIAKERTKQMRCNHYMPPHSPFICVLCNVSFRQAMIDGTHRRVRE